MPGIARVDRGQRLSLLAAWVALDEDPPEICGESCECRQADPIPTSGPVGGA